MMSDRMRQRAADLLSRLETAARHEKGLALSSSDAGTLARHIRELARECEGQKLLAETMAQNPTLSSLAARSRVATKEV